jgi:hypothetical protein
LSYITDEMKAAVGRETGRRVSFPVSTSDIRRWAIAVYWPDPPPRLFWDEEYAKASPYGGIVAPEEFNAFAWMVAAKDDPPVRDAFTDEPDLKFRLNGGMEVEYGVRMRPGDVITSVGRLAEYREREGRLGLMLFTISEDTWTNQDDELIKRSRSTLISY